MIPEKVSKLQLKSAKITFLLYFGASKCLFPVLLNLSAAKAMPIWHFIFPYLVPSLQYVLLLPSYLKQIKSSTQAKNAIANQIGTLRSLINDHACLLFSSRNFILLAVICMRPFYRQAAPNFAYSFITLHVYSSLLVYQKPESR